MLSWLLLMACSAELTVTVPKATLQQKLAEAFPIARGRPELAQVTLTDPVLRLPGGDRLEIDVSLAAVVPNIDQIAVPEAAVAEGAETIARAADALRRASAVALQAATAPREELDGALGLAGTLAYHPDEGAFYLHAPQVTRLQLDGQPAQRTDRIRSIAEQGAIAVLDRVPVYTLDHDVKQRAAKLVLRDIHADPSGLKITLGP